MISIWRRSSHLQRSVLFHSLCVLNILCNPPIVRDNWMSVQIGIMFNFQIYSFLSIAVFGLLQVEQFWSFYTHLVRPGDLPDHSDYHLFKDGIKPLWEVYVIKCTSVWVRFFSHHQLSTIQSWEKPSCFDTKFSVPSFVKILLTSQQWALAI